MLRNNLISTDEVLDMLKITKVKNVPQILEQNPKLILYKQDYLYYWLIAVLSFCGCDVKEGEIVIITKSEN